MQPSTPGEKFRKDYKPTSYLVKSIHLDFNLGVEDTKVKSRLHVKPNHSATNGSAPEMFLNGEQPQVLHPAQFISGICGNCCVCNLWVAFLAHLPLLSGTTCQVNEVCVPSTIHPCLETC